MAAAAAADADAALATSVRPSGAAPPTRRTASMDDSTPPLPGAAAAPLAGAAADAVASPGEPIPLYRTRIPPAATLRFALTRGPARGEATLRWRPTDEGYALALESALDGGVVASQTSDGTFDVAGLAPHRYLDRRTRRAALATNFGRDSGEVGFSGSGRRLPLVAGVQDRVSWLVQLAAVVAAEGPSRCADDRGIRLPVVGLRGEADVWAFRCAVQGGTREAVASGAVTSTAVTSGAAAPLPVAIEAPVAIDPVAPSRVPGAMLRLVRAGTAPYDLDIEVWLDPARHHLPARVAWRNGALGTPIEMTLVESIAER